MLEELETLLLEGTQKVSCTPGPRKKSSDFIRDWARPSTGGYPVMVGGAVGGWPWLTVEMNTLVAVVLGSTPRHGHYCRLPFSHQGSGIGQSTWERIQSNDPKDDTRSQKRIVVPNKIPEMCNKDLEKRRTVQYRDEQYNR